MKYYLTTRQYWDGDLMNPRSGSYTSAIALAQVLKRFDFDGGCWAIVEVRDENRVIYTWKKEEHSTFDVGINILKYQLNVLAQALVSYAHVSLSDEDKRKMVNITIHALNCGSDEAMESAYAIKMRALVSGDNELIEKINYLWEVI